MTNEEKELLLKDICARYPYKVLITNGDTTRTLDYLDIAEVAVDKGYRPYLRPMSSMTEEEKKEYHSILDFREKEYGNEVEYFCMETDIHDCFDFLNSHHLDYRGLIPMGLALPAEEGMYNKMEE